MASMARHHVVETFWSSFTTCYYTRRTLEIGRPPKRTCDVTCSFLWPSMSHSAVRLSQSCIYTLMQHLWLVDDVPIRNYQAPWLSNFLLQHWKTDSGLHLEPKNGQDISSLKHVKTVKQNCMYVSAAVLAPSLTNTIVHIMYMHVRMYV